MATRRTMISAITQAVLILSLAFLAACSTQGGENNGSEERCAAGELGCACDSGDVCGLDASGGQMACSSGICVQPPCTPGSAGCSCDAGSCDSGLECSSASGVERCEISGCAVGSEGCGCNLDRSCDSGLSCLQGVCESLSCASGDDGCACSRRFTCDAGFGCDLSSQRCAIAGTCTTGNHGCACKADGSCVSGLTCNNGLCVDPSCAAGLDGCACLNDTCGFDAEGNQLECTGGLCQSPSCPAGAPGCACINGETCDDGGTCSEGFCKQDECIPGSVGCDCLVGTCNPGLTCQNETVCVDNTGSRGGPCFEDNTCSRNNRCDDAVVPAVCVACDLGSIGCQCQDDNSCNPGLSCVQGYCAGDATVALREPNTDASCYTPCASSLVTESETRRCEQGLMEGCLEGMTCMEGSCVEAGGTRSMCFQDSDCPSFQLCMQGYCYVECETNSDCDADTFCHQKVCRQTCTLTGGECEGGQVCETEDGESGYCFESSAQTGQQQDAQPGGFKLSNRNVEFTNTRVATEITLENLSDEYVTYTIRKVEHDVLFSDGTSDVVNDYDADSSCTGASCPLWWLEIGEFGQISPEREARIRVEPNCGDNCPKINVRIANGGSGVDAVRWRGVIEVLSDSGSDRIDLSYVSSPQGRWAGTMVYFANFETTGIDTEGAVTGWLDKANRSDVSSVQNGLIQKWGAFRAGNLTGGWDEMLALLSATQSGQWQFPTVQEDCIVDAGACYLFDAGAGALPKVYVTLLDAAPIPTGVSEFQMAMNIHIPESLEPDKLEGRVVSDTAQHYAGNPKVSIDFDGNPADTATCSPSIRSNCVNFIEDFELNVNVGGHYPAPSGTSTCPNGFEYSERPWLVTGFLDSAYQDPLSGRFYRGYCIDGRLPNFPVGAPEELEANMNLARSNPIPTGVPLERSIELLDGAMIDQTEIFILFRETFPSFLDETDEITAYGYMVLKRQPVQIDEADEDGDGTPDQYEGAEPPMGLSAGAAQSAVACSRELLDDVLGTNVSLSASNAPGAIRTLIYGGEPLAASVINSSGNEEVHYLCEDTGLFDGGPGNTFDWEEGMNGPNNNACARVNGACEDGGVGSTSSACSIGTDLADCGWRYQDLREACPRGSNVVFFTTNASLLPNIHDEGCQLNGSCMDTLKDWIDSGSPILEQLRPKWTCSGDSVFCDDNELDRRHGKTFYKAGASDIAFIGLQAEMDEAFRYKTRFQSRDGSSSVGFSPSICEPFSTTTPYCYDPDQIAGLRERSDCLLHIYDSYYDSFAGSSRDESDTLYTYLEEHFSLREEVDSFNQVRSYDGFERLYAELLIMLGDEAYTAAFEARFDLAGSLAASFEGSAFEDDGIDLSGIAGFEMVKLYQAVQYYDMVLTRFYSMGDVIGAALASGSPATARNFISSATVTSYFDRLIRASTQRSRAMSEIARRYQAFNRADLARKVTERAYTSTYLESVILANLIIELYEISGGSERPQILLELEKSQRRYRTALVDLANVNNQITNEINFFGYPADYVPFPALENSSVATSESNAFEKVLRTAISKMEVAKSREDTALSSTRNYETDEASFQAELTRITRTFENQLGEICGTFEGTDGLVYPAVERYAYLDERLELIGEPCGFAGNGAIHRAWGEVDLAQIEIRRLAVQAQNIYEQVQIEEDRVRAQCDLGEENLDFVLDQNEKTFTLNETLVQTQQTIDAVMRGVTNIARGLELVQCEPAECASVPATMATLVGTYAASEVAIGVSQASAANAREERNTLEIKAAKWNTQMQCEAAEINSNATTGTLMLGLKDIEVSVLAADYRLQLAIAEVIKLRNQARRLELEWQESLDTTVNIEAAKNDPNIRIYRNDSVINAELSFEDALREAYRLTVVYEYYTSTTYADRDQLFLIRMVSAGDYNLENYVYELRNAFTAFEETFGIPDLRVEVVSLKDDIFAIPYIDNDGTALSIDERTALLKERLQDPGLLNADGYLAIPFRTYLERLSPLTRNHKVFYMESNIEGNDNGDFLGRLYVRQVGTSTIRSVEDELQYYRFPARTAVLNPFFNGNKSFKESTELYRSYRMRELPLVNSDWELIINQRDEVVNQDINLAELTDIKLYVFYTDFTVY